MTMNDPTAPSDTIWIPRPARPDLRQQPLPWHNPNPRLMIPTHPKASRRFC